jgi:hypothetical protein
MLCKAVLLKYSIERNVSMKEESKSEVARLMRSIELEYEAAKRGFEGPAITARHAFINARMERISDCHEELKQHVGEDKAIQLLFDLHTRMVE